MSIKDIYNLPINTITQEDSVLFLWVNDSHLKEGIKLCEKWGFKFKVIAFVWEKLTKNGKLCANVGAWTMKNTEICLLATKGAMYKYKNKHNIFQLVKAERTEHSKKPNQVRQNIELLFGNLPRIELFARQKTKGWTSIGYDIDGRDIKESLELLAR